MSCYHPLQAYRTSQGVSFSELARNDNLGTVWLACGRCIGCRLKRAREWSFRIVHEASLYDRNCFVTLTYGRDRLPPGASLHYADYKKFMRRLVHRFGPVRFFMCGEYGPVNLRPHYHACLFGIDFLCDSVPAGKSGAGAVFFSSRTLDSLWGHGMCTVQPLVKETAAYCARYVVDKITGDEAQAHYGDRVPEFCRCSLKPGIGAQWFNLYNRDVFPRDHIVFEGKEYPVPRYYDRLLRRRSNNRAFELDVIENAREERAIKGRDDRTADRLAVRETVERARVRNQRRDFGGYDV